MKLAPDVSALAESFSKTVGGLTVYCAHVDAVHIMISYFIYLSFKTILHNISIKPQWIIINGQKVGGLFVIKFCCQFRGKPSCEP